jgi:hypothetical protein
MYLQILVPLHLPVKRKAKSQPTGLNPLKNTKDQRHAVARLLCAACPYLETFCCSPKQRMKGLSVMSADST